MADLVYTSFKRDIQNGTIDLDTDTVKCALVTSTYTPSAAHAKFSEITNEVTGGGYTAGGATMTCTVSNSGTIGVFDASDVTWGTATITARAAVIYKATGTATTSPLVCYVDFGSDKVASGGDFTISWNASGIVNLT